MTPERYEVVRRIFDDVCDLPDAEREAAIDRACGADVELAAEVRTLLEHDAGATTSGDVEVRGFDLDDESVDEGLPERIGRYRVVRRIGAGGMGVVYEAQQDEPRRSVAIKILRADPAVTAIMRRFQREVHVLGLLRHSGIAQVYDAGRIETATGPRAYFAMEFVDGEPILEYARRCDLSVPDRLELVRRLCDAVQHAHAKGVVHRDLKPSNILVMADGQPKILDFGVARLMDPEGRGTSLHTQVGQLIGTLPYMSPEQASGVPDAVDTRSDVYALGILLYELLAARPPYDLADKMMHEALRVIQEDEPESLSRIERSLRGDVDTIVATALAKDKERRYQTASALSEDIRRFLDNEPIAARPPSAMYHLGKLVRRHRVAAALLAALVVVSVAFGIIGTVQAGQLRDASGRIAKESEEKSRRLYVSQIAQANLLRRDFSLEQMDQVLDACDEGRRGWEWRWLKSQATPYMTEIAASHPPLVAVGVVDDDFLFFGMDGEYFVGRLARDNREVFRVKPRGFTSSSISLSRSCELLAVGDLSGVIRVWRISTGELLLEEHVCHEAIGKTAFSDDEKSLLVANNGPRNVVKEKVETKILAIELDGEHSVSGISIPSIVLAMTFDRSAQRVLVGDVGGTIRMFRYERGEQHAFSLEGKASVEPFLSRITFLDDQRIAVGHNGLVTLLDGSLNKLQVLRHRHSAQITDIACDGDDYVATIDAHGEVLVQSIAAGKMPLRAAAQNDDAGRVQFMPNGQWVFTWGYDSRLRIWSLRDRFGYQGNVNAVEDPLAVLDRRRQVVVGAAWGGTEMVARRVATGDEVARIELPAKAACAVFQPTRMRVVVATATGELLAWDLASKAAERLGSFSQSPTELHVCNGGEYLIALVDGRLICLNEDGQTVATKEGSTLAAASCGNDRAVVLSEGGVLRVLALPTLDVIQTVESIPTPVRMIRAAPSGDDIAIATADRDLVLLSLVSGEVMLRIDVRMPIAAMEWLADGSRILTGGENHAVQMWDPASGDLLLSWVGAESRVTQIWTEDDRVLARSSLGGLNEWSTARSLDREAVLRACFLPRVGLMKEGGAMRLEWDVKDAREWNKKLR